MYVRTESRVLIEVSRMINSDNRSLIWCILLIRNSNRSLISCILLIRSSPVSLFVMEHKGYAVELTVLLRINLVVGSGIWELGRFLQPWMDGWAQDAGQPTLFSRNLWHLHLCPTTFLPGAHLKTLEPRVGKNDPRSNNNWNDLICLDLKSMTDISLHQNEHFSIQLLLKYMYECAPTSMQTNSTYKLCHFKKAQGKWLNASMRSHF